MGLNVATVATLDLASATLEEALLSQFPFELEVRPDRCVTALALTMEAELFDGFRKNSVESEQKQILAGNGGNVNMVFHMPIPSLPGIASSNSEPLELRGSEYPKVYGHITTAWIDDHLEVTLELRGSRSSDGRGGKGPEPRSSATFIVPS